jgi:hypothetical protein
MLRSVLAASSGLALTWLAVAARIDDPADALVVVTVLEIGPLWALVTAAVSDDADFPGAWRPRTWWLEVLPWTFLTALLLVPNLVLLATFVRDARADGGRSAFTWDRMRPGDVDHDHHWP